MDLKFYLNKILKIDNIEGYTLRTLNEIKVCYDEFIEKSEGIDPEYPGYTFGDAKKGLKFDLRKASSFYSNNE